MSTQEELKSKVAAGKARRASRVKAFDGEAAMLRLQNEAKLVEIEDETGLTLGIDLGVVWCPNGAMVAVRKPDFGDYETFQLESSEAKAKDKPKLLEEYLRPCVVFPKTALELDSLCELYGDVKFEAANLMSHMHDVDKASMEGKS